MRTASARGLRANPWFYTSLVFLATTAATSAGWFHTVRQRAPARVLQVQPEGRIDPLRPIRISFSREMVSPDGLDSPADLAALAVTPAVALEGHWRTTKTLELRGRDGFPRATPFQLRIEDSLLDSEGYPIAAATTREFYTPPLEVVDVRQVGLTDDWQLSIALSFNDDVPLAHIDTHLHVRDGAGDDSGSHG